MIRKFTTFSGFTLIELLVVLAVFVVLALFATQSISNILQTRNKVEASRNVRQEADYTTMVLERHLRGALSATCTSPTQVSYRDADGKSSAFSCVNPGTQNSYIASSSARITSSDIVVVSCSFTCPVSSQVSFAFTMRQAKITSDPKETSNISVSSQVMLRNQ